MCEQDRDIKEQKSWIKTTGCDCSNICDVVYYEMCAQCSKEYECHKSIDHCTPIIDHEKMLDCVLKKLIIKSEDELHDVNLIKQTIEELEKLDFVKSVDADNYKCVSIRVNMIDDSGWIDNEKSKTVYGMYYNLLKSLKNSVSVDIDINSGD